MKETLQEHGFTEKEASIYLAVLEIGAGSASTVARKAEEKRLTTYNALKSLIQKGIATEYIHNGTAWYHVISPDQLLALQKNKLHTQLERLEGILPELMAHSNAIGYKPKIYFFDGLEGLKQIYEDSLSSDYMRAMLGKEKMHPKFAEYLFEDYVPRRIAKKIETKLIYATDSNNFHEEFLQSNNPEDHAREIIIIDDEDFMLYNSTFMHSGDKVSIALFSNEEMCGLTIQSKFLHDSMKSIFNILRKVYSSKKNRA